MVKRYSPDNPARICFLNVPPTEMVLEIWFGMISELRHIPWIRLLMLDLTESGIQQAVGWGADLLITHARTPDANTWLAASGLPVINTSGIPDPPPFPTVTLDNHQSGGLAARHLLDKGYAEFGFIGDTGFRHARERFEGFTETIIAAGGDPPAHFSKGLQSFGLSDPNAHVDAARELFSWTQSRGTGLGIMVLDDFFAQVVMDHLRLVDPDFLQHIGLVSCHHFRQPTFPSVSGIKQSEDRWGRAVAKLAVQLLNGTTEIPPLTLIPPVGILVRETTASRNTDDLLVRKAMHKIHRDAVRGINVQDVVDAMEGIQRRALERRFAQAIGHSILEEIQRARIQRACLLLSDTEQSLDEIAANAGFSDTRHLQRVFRSKLSITPNQYRLRSAGKSEG